MRARKKITIVGSGRIGSSVAQQLVTRQLGDILLVDVIEGLPQGEALDLSHMASEQGSDVEITGSNKYEDMDSSDLVIVSAGLARKPGMTRLDLLQKNAEIIKNVSEDIARYAPRSMILMITNPMDVMTYVALKVTGFKSNHVFGMGGMLDLSRFKYFLAIELGVSRSSINALVIGEHGETMLPLPRFSTVNGVPVTDLLSPEETSDAVEKTRKIAAEVIALKGATIYAPAQGVATMVEAVIKDKKMLLPLSAYLTGEYGFNDVYVGVPAILGASGVEKIVELKLNDEEQALFQKSVEALQSANSSLHL